MAQGKPCTTTRRSGAVLYGSLEEVAEHKDEIYFYPDCETMTDVAYYYIDELQVLGDIPSQLQNYIDYEAYGRNLDTDGLTHSRPTIQVLRGLFKDS